MEKTINTLQSALKNNSLIVIGIIAFIAIIGLSASQSVKTKDSEASTDTVRNENASTEQKKYTVKKGDHLWKIAESEYGSGYNAYDIAKANKITNPNSLAAGQELIIPSVSPKAPTKGEITNKAAATEKKVEKETKYTIKRNDTLWSISEQFYGTGYMWEKLAKANNLTRPNLIHADNTIAIPAN